ncbi:MAG: hypothetical protein ABSE73_08665 [Planctomycetota bacterium]
MNTPSSEDLKQTLEDFGKVQGSALVVGGMAVIHYGYERSTKDIDALYAYADSDILERLKPNFKLTRKSPIGWHHLEHRKTGVRLELIPEGVLGTYGFIPGPKAVGGENGFISLYGLVWLKLISWRLNDRADLDILAKARTSEFAALREKLHPEMLERFDEIIAGAKRDMEFDPHGAIDTLRKGIGSERVEEAPAPYAKKKRAARTKRKTEKTPAQSGK